MADMRRGPDPSVAVIRGRLAADPELRSTGTGRSVANVTILSSGWERDSAGNPVDQTPTSWRCVAWGDMADHVAASFGKGIAVVAVARPVTERYARKDGSTGWATTWTLDDIAASVRRATVQVTKAGQSNGFAPQPSQPAQPAPAGDGFDDPWQ